MTACCLLPGALPVRTPRAVAIGGGVGTRTAGHDLHWRQLLLINPPLRDAVRNGDTHVSCH